jgi:hypothetical protein
VSARLPAWQGVCYIDLHMKIKLNQHLWARIAKCAERAGYSSPEEFVEHVLEREVQRLEQPESKESVIRKLKGLGYIE